MTISMNRAEMRQTFPSAEVEPKWSLADAIQVGPLFAMYLLLGARVVESPRGQVTHVTLLLDDTEMVLTKEDYEFVQRLAESYITGYLDRKGYHCPDMASMQQLFRSMPSLIVEAIRWMTDDAFATHDVGEARVKIFWLFPDNGASGHYRSERPHMYLDKNFKDDFFSQIASFINYKALTYFDAAIFNRVQGSHILAMLQNLKLENKLIVWETDDDLLNIPDWSISKLLVGQESKDNFETCRNMADIIFVTTEALAKAIDRPEITYVAPNLIDMERFTVILGGQRPLLKQYTGFVPKRVKSMSGAPVKFFNKKGQQLSDELEKKIETEYKPVRILWSGSNTHDADIAQIIPAIEAIGTEYGIGVKFFWFGYCPTIFAEAVMLPGNVAGQMSIKQEYAHYMEYVSPVDLKNFPEMLRRIAPDFAICPLLPHQFNECKSNIKPLEMGAMGVPSVVSDFGPYKFIKHRFDGLKVEHSDDENVLTTRWFAAMSQMIEQRHLRDELAENIYQRVYLDYSWQNDSENRRKWDILFAQIKSKVEVRRAERKLRNEPMFAARELGAM